MPALPSDFCYKTDSYSYAYQPSVVNTEFSTGRSRNRQIEQKYAFIYTVAFDFDQDQFDRWEAFIYYDLQNGSLEFTAPYWNGAGNTSIGTFRFLPDTYSNSKDNGQYLVNFSMELINRNFDAEDALKTAYLASGQSWQEFGIYGEFDTFLSDQYWESFSVANPTVWDNVNRQWYCLTSPRLETIGDWYEGLRPKTIRITLKQYLPWPNGRISISDRALNIIANSGTIFPQETPTTFDLTMDWSNDRDIRFISIFENDGGAEIGRGNYITNIQFVD